MIGKRTFGTCSGEKMPVYWLSNGRIEAELLPFGATLRALRVPDRDGTLQDVCLGYDDPESYRKLDGCLGGTVGRCANRIGGASFQLNGVTCSVTANEGHNCLHGGREGFHLKMWFVGEVGDDHITFVYISPDLEEGFPGEAEIRATYRLTGDTLTLSYEARTTRDTVINLTNHTYFNLAGRGEIGDHELLLRAERYTPADSGNIPFGITAPVEGTPLDLRRPTILGARLDDPFLSGSCGYDHNFVLDGGDEPAAELYCSRTGIGMALRTDLEGLQLYSAGFLGERRGKRGAVYGPRHGLCLETQHFPDAVNQPGFPSPVVRAGEIFRTATSWQFYTR